VSSVLLSWWPWELAAVIVLCWGVGACSRLLRLRAAVARAFAALAPVWQRRLAWVQARSFEPESANGQRLAAARGQCALILEQACKKPIEAARIQSFALAGNALDAAWTAAAAEMRPSTDTKSEAGGLTWDALGHQALPLQMAFNVQVARYNRAVALFPASVLAFALRFKRAEFLPVSEGQT
jgi:LemA protein